VLDFLGIFACYEDGAAVSKMLLHNAEIHLFSLLNLHVLAWAIIQQQNLEQ